VADFFRREQSATTRDDVVAGCATLLVYDYETVQIRHDPDFSRQEKEVLIGRSENQHLKSFGRRA